MRTKNKSLTEMIPSDHNIASINNNDVQYNRMSWHDIGRWTAIFP